MFIVKKAPTDGTAGADCLESEHVMFGNQYAFTVPFLPDLSSRHLSCKTNGGGLSGQNGCIFPANTFMPCSATFP